MPTPLTSLGPVFASTPAPVTGSGTPMPRVLERPTSVPARRFQNFADATSPLSSIDPYRTMKPLDPNTTSPPGPDWSTADGAGESLPKFKFANPNALDWSLLSDLF